MSTVIPPTEFRIGGRQRLVQTDHPDVDDDPRGLVFLYEPPSPKFKYVMGIDATQGRTGWSRYSRSDDDQDIDNGAVEVIRVGSGEPGTPEFKPDMHVAEYAAPIDPYDLAKMANALGRLYGGNDEDGQAHAIIEVYPGPGGPTQRVMMEQYGYTNFYRWQYLDTGMTSDRARFDYGWYSTKQSMQHLWTKGLRYIHRKQLVFKSPYLVEEFADCEMDLVKLRGTASRGHDDRVMACLMALWAAHNWTFNVEPAASKVSAGPAVEWQRLDISSERMFDEWDAKWAELSAEADQGSA
jgi:hypothetical protein